jgi:hypothetical protein
MSMVLFLGCREGRGCECITAALVAEVFPAEAFAAWDIDDLVFPPLEVLPFDLPPSVSFAFDLTGVQIVLKVSPVFFFMSNESSSGS